MSLNALVNGVLLALVLVAALSVVTSQHEARKLFIALQQGKEHARQMEVEWGQLQLEQRTWAAPARVETIASQQLQMQLPKKELKHQPQLTLMERVSNHEIQSGQSGQCLGEIAGLACGRVIYGVAVVFGRFSGPCHLSARNT
jgi:cell division protein FtsL